MENKNKPNITPSQLLMILACVAIAFLERRRQMKPKHGLFLLIFFLSGCSHDDRPKFEVWITPEKTVKAHHIFVSPGGFAAFGKTIAVTTTEGVVYIEKDLSNIQSIFFLSEKAKEMVKESEKSLDERIAAARERRKREQDDKVAPNLLLTHLDGRSVLGYYDTRGVDLIYETEDVQAYLPLSSVMNIEHYTESSGGSGASAVVGVVLCLMILTGVISVWFRRKPERSGYVRYTKRAMRGDFVSPSRSSAFSSSSNRNRVSRTRPLGNDSEVDRDDVLGVCIVVRHGSRGDDIEIERGN